MSKEDKMSQEEIKHWIGRWKSLKPSKMRDMILKIWSKGIKPKQR